MWNYAELSKCAKAVGGPEELVKTITNNGRVEGVVLTLIISGTIYGIYKFCKCVDESIMSNDEYIAAKDELIEQITAYDESDERNDGAC